MRKRWTNEQEATRKKATFFLLRAPNCQQNNLKPNKFEWQKK